ncbi:GerW family sporulation protein [Methanobacterium sp. ACI-7]|uniref:GerW family sporulation protein n=1 Tax=unclassified Methanobacterium TaxID=2627676 RepID=UPI0039C3CE4B
MADEMMEHMSGMIRTTVDELLRVLATDNVIGETIEVDDKVIIPITKIGLAFGTGAGRGGMMRGQEGKGHGTGGGAAMETKAVVVIHKNMSGPESVEVITIGPAATLAHVMSKGGTMAKKAMEKGMKKKPSMGGQGKESGEMPKGPGSESQM